MEMSMEPQAKPSFSPWRKWGIAVNVALVITVVFAVVVMINYLSQEYFARVHLSRLTRNELSPRTLGILRSLTNTVRVVVYYDREDPLFSTVCDLLNEYKLANPKVTVQTVDFLRDAAVAQKLRAEFKLAPPADKNLVIFDCQGRSRIVEGNALGQYILEQIPGEKDREFRRKPVAFLGETMFTAGILHVTQPKALKACFLEGHGEHRIGDADALTGYVKFAGLLLQNYIEPHPISVLGTNEIPADCNLLVIAGPRAAISAPELAKIRRYLDEGKRLLVMLNVETAGKVTGLEPLLAEWGVQAGDDTVIDPEHTSSGSDVIISAFSRHEIVNPVLGAGIYMIRPRSISRIEREKQPPAEAAKVEEVAFTGQRARLARNSSAEPRRYPVMTVVEKGGPQGVINEKGAARMVVAGDSYFLANNQLDLVGNRDFAGAMVNWLLERTQLLEGVGPRPVTEYRLVMTAAQARNARWLLLAGMPGAVLAIGALVYWRRTTG
jgi:ABC-type uncharacterized transport system involved in gliding motility auxiliary subunit